MAVPALSFFVVVANFLLGLHSAEAQIGVCYGQLGDNLPCAEDVVTLYLNYGIGAMRLYGPDEAILEALQGTDITVMLGVPNEDIISIACNQSNAEIWIDTNVVPYATSIKYIAVGNEINSSFQEASYMEPAMQNIQNALNSNGLGSEIKVSTAIDTGLIQDSYPPSKTTFKNLTYITPIINFLTSTDSPLLVNIQPYIAYVNNPKDIKLDYALFESCGTVVNDSGKEYQNLFDAIYDAIYTAIEKVVSTQHDQNTNSLYDDNKKGNKGFKRPVNSESGWPSKGGRFHKKNNGWKMTSKQGDSIVQGEDNVDAATPENAMTYYKNLIDHVKQGKGTPLTPGQTMETYLFAMFDEDKKPGVDEAERHFGLFTPNDQQPKYGQLDF